MQEHSRDSAYSDLPKFAKTKCSEVLKELQKLETEAKIKAAMSEPAELTFSLDEVAEKTKAGTEAKNLLHSLLLAVKKHQGH